MNWSPASKDTNTSKTDPNNANVRRPEFAKWYLKDIPLLKGMNVNTVRTFIDMGFNATALAILDEFYRNDIMVILTVDDAINDLNRVQQAVNFYKNHPAILMWMLGNEWNIAPYYYGVASSVLDAAQRTQKAAALIKGVDTNHPVGTSYGEININATGLRLADTRNYVQNICRSVDVWALNIYRGSSFGSLFEQWKSITDKPMVLGEFGTDAFRSTSLAATPSGFVEEPMQSHWALCLWNELFWNLSARDPSATAVGGLLFEWNDEWWKVSPAGTQQLGGYVFPGGHPDDYANEEWFGIVALGDTNRIVRQKVYQDLQAAFDPDYLPQCSSVVLGALSRGATAQQYPFQYGVARFYRCGKAFYERTGGGGGGRGFNLLAINPATGGVVRGPTNFDTYITRDTGTAMRALIAALTSLPQGTLVMLAVADEAGLTLNGSCTKLPYAWTEEGLRALEDLGSREIRNYCYWGSWSMVALKGEGYGFEESLAQGSGAAVKFIQGNQSCAGPVLQ